MADSERIDRDRLMEHVKEIVSSNVFRKVPVQRVLLQFLAKEWVGGREDKVKGAELVAAGLIPRPRPHRIARRIGLTGSLGRDARTEEVDTELLARIAMGR